jgi:site-specific DNA recombinase
MPNSPDHPTTPRVAFYRRISTDESNQSTSLPTQLLELTAFAEAEGYKVVADFSDQKTGTTFDRPGLQDLLRAAANGDFDVILIHTADRIAREQLVAYMVLDALDKAGVWLRSAKETWDLRTPEGRMLFAFYATFAALEREKMAERCKRGMTEAQGVVEIEVVFLDVFSPRWRADLRECRAVG